MSFDGERNKSRDVLNILKNMFCNSKIDIVNYSKNKYIQTIKLLFKLLFHKYDLIFVSKCIVGGSFAIYLINHFKKNRDKICFYLIGNGYEGFENKKIYFSDISKCKSIIVESPRYPATMFNDSNLPRVMYILLKSNKLANCSLEVGSTSWSQTFINLYNPNLTVNTANFIAGTLLKIMIIKDNGTIKAVLLESGITNNRSRFIHLCIDQETAISYAGLSYTASDIINVYRNGVRLFQDVDYSINAAAQTITLYVRTEDGERIIFETSKG